MSSPKSNQAGILILSLSIVFGGVFLFSQALQSISQQYYDVFFPLVLGVTVFWALALFIEKYVSNQPFIFNENIPNVIFSRLPYAAKLLFFGGLLSLLFSIGAIGLGSPIIDLPQPFTEQALSTVTEMDKIFYQAVIPGFFEESTVYIIVLCIKFVLMFFVKNKKALLLVMLISAGIGAAALTQAHRVAYGSNTSSYVGVFFFEWVVQFFNLWTGAFISWLPHMVHNGVVVLNFLVGFTLGGALSFIPWRRYYGKKTDC